MGGVEESLTLTEGSDGRRLLLIYVVAGTEGRGWSGEELGKDK